MLYVSRIALLSYFLKFTANFFIIAFEARERNL